MLNLTFSKDEFVSLLEKLIGQVENLQNCPPDHIPKEELAADIVIDYLKPYSTELGGPLIVRKCTYVPSRSNLVLEYPGKLNNQSVVSFVGSHLDVVPAVPHEWDFDPFRLTRDGDDVLRGRGVTDCLGHVAMIAVFFKQLAIKKPNLKRSVKAIFIASEENSSIPGVGIEEMQVRGELESFKNGPLFWVDSANFGPTLGCAGALTWEIEISGKTFHSGLPHKAINTIELAHEVCKILSEKFHEKYAKCAFDEQYKFIIGSSFKPTQISVPKGGLNQIPGQCTVKGDIRLTPAFNFDEVKLFFEKAVAEIDVTAIQYPGYSKFHLPEEGLKADVKLKWLEDPYDPFACNMDSEGYRALKEATLEVHKKDREFSVTGSLPLVADLKKAGYDVQICGFGRMEAYHAKNEFGLLSEFQQGFEIISKVVEKLE